MSQPNKNTLVYCPEHYTPLDVMQTLWGQILKDTEFYEHAEAIRLVYLLQKLGYEPAFQFMNYEYDLLMQTAKGAFKAQEKAK